MTMCTYLPSPKAGNLWLTVLTLQYASAWRVLFVHVRSSSREPSDDIQADKWSTTQGPTSGSTGLWSYVRSVGPLLRFTMVNERVQFWTSERPQIDRRRERSEVR